MSFGYEDWTFDRMLDEHLKERYDDDEEPEEKNFEPEMEDPS